MPLIILFCGLKTNTYLNTVPVICVHVYKKITDCNIENLQNKNDLQTANFLIYLYAFLLRVLLVFASIDLFQQFFGFDRYLFVLKNCLPLYSLPLIQKAVFDPVIELLLTQVYHSSILCLALPPQFLRQHPYKSPATCINQN